MCLCVVCLNGMSKPLELQDIELGSRCVWSWLYLLGWQVSEHIGLSSYMVALIFTCAVCFHSDQGHHEAFCFQVIRKHPCVTFGLSVEP